MYCSLNSSHIPPKTCEKKKKKNEKNENATSVIVDAISAIQTSTILKMNRPPDGLDEGGV